MKTEEFIALLSLNEGKEIKFNILTEEGEVQCIELLNIIISKYLTVILEKKGI